MGINRINEIRKGRVGGVHKGEGKWEVMDREIEVKSCLWVTQRHIFLYVCQSHKYKSYIRHVISPSPTHMSKHVKNMENLIAGPRTGLKFIVLKLFWQ